MAQLPILSAINLPSATAFPSLNCIQWSEDGQALLITRNAIYILTPSLGIEVEPSFLVKQSLEKDLSGDNLKPVEWFQTLIEWDKNSDLSPCPSDSQDWGAVSLGSLDPYFRSVTCSPSNLTDDAGSVVAILNSNLQTSFWVPEKNHLRGKWRKIIDWDHLRQLQMQHHPSDIDQNLASTLQAQVTVVQWSPQTDFLIEPAPAVDGSIFAVGNRAGMVTFYRYEGGSSSKAALRYISSISVGERWVTHLTWSAWKSVKVGKCETLMACGLSDGSITILKLVQNLVSQPSGSNLVQNYDFSVECEILHTKPCGPCNCGVTSLRWIHTIGAEPILVFSTVGRVHIWDKPWEEGSEESIHTVTLQTQKLSVGSTALSAISGISYIEKHETLVICLADGSFHVVGNVPLNPTLVSSSSESPLSSNTLSAVARSDFLKLEADPVQYADVNRISGAVPYDNSSMYLWIHETSRPSDFDYKHEAKHTSVFVLASLWPDDAEDDVLRDLRYATGNIRAANRTAPLGILRPVFLHLRNPERFSRVSSQVIDILQEDPSHAKTIEIDIPAWSEELSPQLREAYKQSLKTHLFGWDSLLHQRIKIYLSAFCEKQAGDPQTRQRFSQINTSLRASLWHSTLRVILRHIRAVVNVLGDNDTTFVLRIIVQALLSGISDDLATEARDLASKVNLVIPSNLDLNAIHSIGHNETCPACNTEIPFTDLGEATCPNGHSWSRCSITSFILSTPMVRTCCGCGRKAFLPLSHQSSGHNWLPTWARSWLVEDLLDATYRCLFCGNSFVTLV
ncbi:putative zinc-finger of transcription factor IIIC complex-domain-containing protein [Abortiporus biennis]|nr:putative zinc-finger of transcription factor IIIC complex-domain-containing protein [Abortiporus biennis]